MPAGRRCRGKPTRHFLSSRRRPRLTDPAVCGRSRRRPWGKPTHRRRLPLVRGEGQPAVRGHSALPPAVASSSRRYVSVSVLWGLQSAHPPSLVVLLRRGTRLPGGASYIRPLSCVSCVPASCFHIWFVSCPRFMSL